MKPVGAFAQFILVMGSEMADAQAPLSAIRVGDTGSATAGVRVPLGRELEVELRANPTTGYTWRNRLDDPKRLRLKTQGFRTGGSGDQAPLGGGGVQLFTFEATALGTAQLDFEYRRGSAGAPLRTYELIVTVVP